MHPTTAAAAPTASWAHPPSATSRNLIRPSDVGDVAFQVLLHDGDLRHVWRGVAVRRGMIVTPALRAEALGSLVPARGVVGRRSAAWVHLGGPAPRRAELLLAPGSRRPGPDPDRVAFAATLVPADVQVLGGVRVTTPQRTGLDIARCCPTVTALAILTALVPLGFDAAGAWRSLAGLAGHRGVLLAEQTLRILLHAADKGQAAA